MKNKLTVSIGITAYNEEQAFPGLLTTLLSQTQKTYILKRIYVVSDGSTDKTVSNASKIKHPLVTLKQFSRRKGKALRLNDIFDMSKAEVLVLLDADIVITDPLLLEKLVKPFATQPKLAGVSGSIEALKPQNFLQHVVYTGIRLWDSVRSTVNNNQVYYCTGAIRAFRKKLYKEMVFPNITAEDVYPYLYCVSKRYAFKILPHARVYFGLPSTYSDYIHQMTRYLTSMQVGTQYFSNELIKKTYTISTSHKVRSLIKEMLKNPLWTILYVAFLIPPKCMMLLSKNYKTHGLWTMATTSKKVIV